MVREEKEKKACAFRGEEEVSFQLVAVVPLMRLKTWVLEEHWDQFFLDEQLKE